MEEAKILADCSQDELQRRKYFESLSKPSSVSSRERSLAKTTKLVNRLKRFYSESDMAQILNDLSRLDLSMYIEELVTSLIEGYRTMRLRDVNSLLSILCDLLSCYPQLADKFVEYHRKCLDSVLNDNLRIRIYIRVISELTLLGIAVPDLSAELVSLLTTLCTFSPQSISGEILATKLNAIVYWLTRYHGVCLGRPTPTGDGQRMTLTSVSTFPKSSRSEISDLISSFFHHKLPKLLNHVHSLIGNQERRHESLMINKGIVDQESEAKHLLLKSDEEKIKAAIEHIRFIMDYEQVKEEMEQPVAEVEGMAEPETKPPSPEELQFCDDSERSFYQELVDLVSRLPSAALEILKSTKPLDDTFVARIKSISLPDDADILAIDFFESGYNCETNLARIKEIFFTSYGLQIDPAQLRFIATIAKHVPFEFTDGIVDELRRQAKLPCLKGPGSHSLTQIAAIKNLGELSKFSTCPPGVIVKLLRKFLDDFDAHNAEMASWVLTSCGRYMVNKPEVAEVMEEQISRLMKLRNSSAIHLPRRIELMVDHAYYAAKPRLQQGAAGSHARRKSDREKNDLEKYIDHLLQVEIYSSMHEDQILRLVKKLPWSDESVINSLRDGILDLTGLTINFEKSYCIASLLAGLIKYQETFVVDIIDDLFEQFQVTLEKEDFRQSPYRIRLAKLIAELYVYKLIDANSIFDLLFQLIGFRDTSCYGASEHTVLLNLWDEETPGDTGRLIRHPAATDEPTWSQVRILVISTILKTCGEFFVVGRNKIKLKRFLLCLRRYIAIRVPNVPGEQMADIINILTDTYEFLDLPKIDFRKDSLETIDRELAIVIDAIRTAPSAATMVAAADSEDDQAAGSDQDVMVESEETSFSEEDDDSISDAEEYQRNEERREGGELMEFEKEFQALIVEAITEGKQMRVGGGHPPGGSILQRAPPQVVISAGCSSDEETSQAGSFKVLVRSRQGVSPEKKSGRKIFVPETNKLNLSQEKYKAELEAAQREKQAIKRFIMDYQRREERESNAPAAVNAVGSRPGQTTLAMAAGLTSLEAGGIEKKESGVSTRRKYRKL